MPTQYSQIRGMQSATGVQFVSDVCSLVEGCLLVQHQDSLHPGAPLSVLVPAPHRHWSVEVARQDLVTRFPIFSFTFHSSILILKEPRFRWGGCCFSSDRPASPSASTPCNRRSPSLNSVPIRLRRRSLAARLLARPGEENQTILAGGMPAFSQRGRTVTHGSAIVSAAVVEQNNDTAVLLHTSIWRCRGG